MQAQSSRQQGLLVWGGGRWQLGVPVRNAVSLKISTQARTADATVHCELALLGLVRIMH